MPILPAPDRDASASIRFVAHPVFLRDDAFAQIEHLKPDPREMRPQDEMQSSSRSPIGKLCEQPLLSRREERYLFLRMNYEKFAANRSQGADRLAHVAQATAFRDRVLAANFRLLVSLAGQFASPVVHVEDLISEGVVPLMRAVELFDVSRGWAFGTYATHALRNHYRRTGERRQRKNRFVAAIPENQLAELADEGVPADRQRELADRHVRLARQCLAELPVTDQQILRVRFGFDDDRAPKTRSYAEVGRVVGLSKERVRVRTHRALELLRETARDRQWEFPELDSLNLRA